MNMKLIIIRLYNASKQITTEKGIIHCFLTNKKVPINFVHKYEY